MSIQNELLFLGGVFPPGRENEIFLKSRGGLQNAANALQWNLIRGFDRNRKHPVDILNYPFIGPWPRAYTDPWLPDFAFSHAVGAEDWNIGGCNILMLKQHFAFYHIRNALQRKMKLHPYRILIIYSLQPFFMRVVEWAKKEYPGLHVCVIVIDLPEFIGMELDANPRARRIKKKNCAYIRGRLPRVDSFVVITPYIMDFLGIHGKPHVVVDGIADLHNERPFSETPGEKSGTRNILYAGTLTAKYGILNLVRAFRLLREPEYRLTICGYGETENDIRAAAAQDSRITFLGRQPREKVLELENEADVLVNPRQNTDEFTRYSFPSKMMEYLNTGRPIVCYRLDGFGEEYRNYFRYVPDNSPEGLAEALRSACRLTTEERNAVFRKNTAFVRAEKSPEAQTARILEMLMNPQDGKKTLSC